MRTVHADVFEDGLLDRLQAAHPSIDVHAIAADTRDMVRRKRVRKPNGLLIQKVRAADAARRDGQARASNSTSTEQERYAGFWAQLLWRISDEQLPPSAIARALRHAAVSGYPQLNPRVMDHLERMGDRWRNVE